MGSFRHDDRSGGRSFGHRDFGRRSFDDRRGPREMHRAVCSACGKDCEVPFRPTGDKPVYCSQCFERNGGSGGDSRRFSDRRDDARPQNNDQLESIGRKLDKILDLLTKAKTEVKEIKPPKKKSSVKKK